MFFDQNNEFVYDFNMTFYQNIECFDKDDELIVQFFGKRKPGIPEIKEWQEVVAQLQ